MSCPRTPEPRRRPLPGVEKAAPLPPRDENVRRSVGEIGARTTSSSLRSTLGQPEGKPKGKAALIPPDTDAGLQKGREATTAMPPEVERSPKQSVKYKNRTSEAKACLQKAKFHLGNSRNLKAEIKAEVMEALERLYNLVKEAEQERAAGTPVEVTTNPPAKESKDMELQGQETELLKGIKEHSKLLSENKEGMEKLTELLNKQNDQLTHRATYASVAASSPKTKPPETAALHSLVISTDDELVSCEQVIEKVRKLVNAREEGIRIDRIRKAKDRKIIVGCRNLEEIKKVRDRIREQDTELNVEEIKNKDPLIVLFGVMQCNSNDEVVKAIRSQNQHLLSGLSAEDDRIEVRFRRKARNPLTSHIVVKVSPQIWQRLTAAGAVHIDIQRVRVADQSPLIQCSRCLEYGHGKRFCTGDADACSHCGGAHLKTACADYLVDVPPSCTNCIKAKMGKVDHNAFDDVCPVRRKWEALARSTVAYC